MFLAVWAAALTLIPTGETVAQETTIRSRATLFFTFDEESGDVLDTATTGTVKDTGKLQNGAVRIKSPFSGQSGKSALQLQGTQKQFVQVADGADVDQAKSVSISFFYLQLGAPAEPAFQGIFAKRVDAVGKTNYGINFGAQSDTFQVYLNDGTGFRVATFGVKDAIGIRRPDFLTATYEVGDAPGADADTDQDDVLIRLYLNGKLLTPRTTANTTVIGNDSWVTNVDLTGWLNDTPLTIGSSTPTIEFATAVVDEFAIFSFALTPDEVAKLFVEMAGPDANMLAFSETLAAQPAFPELNSVSIQGLETGKTSKLIVSGTNLYPNPRVIFPVTGANITVGPNSNSKQLELEVTIPKNCPSGHVSLRVSTEGGVSNAIPVAVEALRQVHSTDCSVESPVSLPVAASGVVSGAQQNRIYFVGRAGDRLIADLECRRLGSTMTPVLEIKNARGTPLKISWGHVEYRGDTRASIELPTDGVYFAEVHDLAYSATGLNPFRLKLGNLKLADAVVPGATIGTKSFVRIMGNLSGVEQNVEIDLQRENVSRISSLLIPAEFGFAAPAPSLIISSGGEFSEQDLKGMPPAEKLPGLDCRFSEQTLPTVNLTGTLATNRERDLVVLQVTPGQKLSVRVSGQSVDSPLDPQLQLLSYPEGNVIANAENPGSREVGLEYLVAAGQTQLQVAVRDLRSRGGLSFRYRLTISPTGRPDFSLTADIPRVRLAEDGTAAFQVTATYSNYAGPLKLSVGGAPGLLVVPDIIPAGVTQAWVTLKADGSAPAGTFHKAQLLGETVGTTPIERRVASVPNDLRVGLLPEERSALATIVTPGLGTTLALDAIPTTIFRGVDFQLPLKLTTLPASKIRIARLSLLSTEPMRPNDPNKPNEGSKARVDAAINETIDGSMGIQSLRMLVPSDIAVPSIDFVVKGELVEHMFAQNVVGTVYSTPFRLAVQNAITPQLMANQLTLTGGATGKFAGSIKRTAGFNGPVIVQILNLLPGTQAPAVTLQADQESFELMITPPAVATVMDVPNVYISFSSGNGKLLVANLPLPTKITP